jgi:hypothetical protein
MSNHDADATDLRSVPLSCVPPQKRAGTVGTVAIDVNWAICSPVRTVTPAVSGLTVPFRLCQLTPSSGALGPASRPPRLRLYQIPPSEP